MDSSRAYLNHYERLLMQLTEHELGSHAEFLDGGSAFELKSAPFPAGADEVPLGRYELPRRSGEAYLYRMGHPLAAYVVDRARSRDLPPAEITFDYTGHGSQTSAVAPLVGRSGTLLLSQLTVEALDQAEDYLIFAAMTDDGQPLEEDAARRLFSLRATSVNAYHDGQPCPRLQESVARQQQAIHEKISARNAAYFEEEAAKLDSWADDLKVALEREDQGAGPADQGGAARGHSRAHPGRKARRAATDQGARDAAQRQTEGTFRRSGRDRPPARAIDRGNRGQNDGADWPGRASPHTMETGVTKVINYAESSKRHFQDAELLKHEGRAPNAGHLYGVSAECGIKALLVALGHRTDSDGNMEASTGLRKHIDELQLPRAFQQLQNYASGPNGARLLAMLPNVAQFADWKVDHRYYAGSSNTPFPAQLGFCCEADPSRA